MHGIALVAHIALIFSKFCLLAGGRVAAGPRHCPIMHGIALIALIALIFSKYLVVG